MINYLPHIAKDVIAELPIVQHTGTIVVVDSIQEADVVVDILFKESIIGFDTETRPSFVKGVRYTVSLLQLATADTCYLFRLQNLGRHEGLKLLLESDHVKKIGLSVRDDFMALNKWQNMCFSSFIELQKYVEAFGIEEKSLQKIYAIVFGKKISKSQQLSNWEAPTLTHQQQSYAAIDAWSCREIYLELQAKATSFLYD